MGLGVDLVDMRRLNNPEHMAEMILSDRERKEFSARRNQKEYLAGRFAAKEAFLKSRKTGLGGIPLREIEILTGPNGEPVLTCFGREYEVSIAHDGDYAVAVVMS